VKILIPLANRGVPYTYTQRIASRNM